MRSETLSFDYFLPHALRTRSDDVKVTCFAFICCMLAKVFNLTRNFIGAVLYLVEAVSPSNMAFLFLEPCCFVLQKLFEFELSLTIRGSSLFIPSSYGISLRMGQRLLEVISIISSFIALISYIFPSLGSPIVLLFIMMGFLIVSYIMIIPVQPSVFFSSITMGTWLEWLDSIVLSHLTPDLACRIVNRMISCINDFFHTFIVGDGNSFTWRFPPSIIPSRSNSIYFSIYVTDNFGVWRKFHRRAYGGHDVGLFDMVTRDILPLKFGVFIFSITVDNGLEWSDSSKWFEWSDSSKWSHPTPDLACGIVNRMTAFTNYIAAKGVNRDWRSAFSSNSFQLPLPALLLSQPPLTDMRTLFSLCDQSHHRLQLSEVRGKRIWGSQHGWVVTLDPRYLTQLVHLMTGRRIDLPQIRGLAPQEEWFCLVHKFILLKDPTDDSTFLVFTIFGPMNSLAFTRVRLEAALNRKVVGEWVVVANSETLKFKDVAHFNGQIYALCDNGKLVRFEADAPLADMVQVIADHPQDAGAHRKVYLVESLGHLYGVHRIGCLTPSQRRFETISFVVYKFNFNASAWEEVTHLEGQAFFVGDGNSFSWRFPTSTIPSRSNSIYFTRLFRTSTITSRSDCIYFTDDWWDWQMDPRIQAFGGHDVGVFDMASRVVQPLAFGIGKDNPCFYSRPIWVTRSHKLI